MQKSISLSNPDQILSLIVEPQISEDSEGTPIMYKIGGNMDLSIFTNATNIDVSNNDITGFGDLPSTLTSFDCSKNKLVSIPTSFVAPTSILSFDLSENNLTSASIDDILNKFTVVGDVTATSPNPVIDVSGFGNAIPSATGLGYITTLTNNGWQVNYIADEYALTSSVISTISEGFSFTVTTSRTSSDIADGTLVPYTITGIQANDITEDLTGNFNITNNTATATFNIESDIGVSGFGEVESFILTLDGDASITIPITDTTPSPYALTAVSSEDEGQSFNITISTVGTNVTNGTTVPYTITGIQADDITESLTGIFTINNNTDSITINVVANSPGDENETMVITLDDYPTSASIIIHDGPEPFNYASTDGVDDKMVINFSTAIDISSVSVDHRGDESSGPFTSGALGISFNSGSIAEGGFAVGSLGSGSYSNSNAWVTTEVVQTITTLNSITVGFADTGSPTYISRDYSNLVVKDTLGNIIVNLPLNEQATGSLDGVTAIDSSGNSYDGTYTGCTGGSYTP